MSLHLYKDYICDTAVSDIKISWNFKSPGSFYSQAGLIPRSSAAFLKCNKMEIT